MGGIIHCIVCRCIIETAWDKGGVNFIIIIFVLFCLGWVSLLMEAEAQMDVSKLEYVSCEERLIKPSKSILPGE